MKRPAWLYRLLPYLGRRAAERDLQEELRLHLELERERQRDAGVPEAEAMLAARRRLGNGTSIRERTRDVWGWRWLDDLGRDVRHALRGLRRGPGFTGTVVLVLALGIGANTALFSVAYGLLLRPLPYPDPEAIVLVGKVWPDSTGPPTLTNPELRALWADAGSFDRLAASSRLAITWTRPDGSLSGAAVTPSYFSVLGTKPHLGRLFTPADTEEGAPRVVLLSHDVWTSRFGSDPDVVGDTVDIDRGPHTVVGVLPEGFEPARSSARFRTPLVVAPYEPSPDGALEDPGFMLGVGRLRPGVSPDRAQAEVRTIIDPAQRPRPRRRRPGRRRARVHGRPFRGGRPGLRNRAGPRMVARRSDSRPQRGTRRHRRRPRTPAGEPGTGGARGGAGRARGGPPDRRRAAAAEFRGVRHPGSRVRPDQRREGQGFLPAPRASLRDWVAVASTPTRSTRATPLSSRSPRRCEGRWPGWRTSPAWPRRRGRRAFR